MYVTPASGLTIRDPDLKDYLPSEGREVPNTDYWFRRIRDKDVIEGKAPVISSKATTRSAE